MRRWGTWLGFFVATCVVAGAAWLLSGELGRRWVMRRSPIEKVKRYGFAGRVVDVHGKPIADAHVSLRSRWSRGDMGPATEQAVTDAEGRFLAHYVPPYGAYAVSVRPAGSRLTYAGQDGGPLPDLSFPRELGSNGRMVITVDASWRLLGGRVVGEDGAGIANATVVVLRENGSPYDDGERRLQTSGGGYFPTILVPAGRYRLEVITEHPDRHRYTHLQAGETDAVIALPDVTTLVGTLTGFPPDTTVQIIAKDTAGWELHVNGSGFTLPNAPRGELLVGAFGGSAIDIASVHVDPPGPALVHLAARPVARVTGRVFDDAIRQFFYVPNCNAFVARPEAWIGPIHVHVDKSEAFAFDAPIGERIELECSLADDFTGRVTIDEVRAGLKPVSVDLHSTW